MEGKYKIPPFENDEIKIVIKPEPKIDLLETDEIPSIHKAKRVKREIRGEKKLVSKSAPFPLNLIIHGQEELFEGAFDEVWVVFDHDNHPARKEAFALAESFVNGKQVSIAFSSISFEYFLLLHFERIYKQFKTSECRDRTLGNKKIYNCGTSQHPNDCYGEDCIGGYARKKGYWTNSKSLDSCFQLVENKLEIGFINSAWVRFISDKNNKQLPIYERNPYVTSDYLIKRLTGLDLNEYMWLDSDSPFVFDSLRICVVESGIEIENIGNSQIIIPQDSVSLYYDDGSKTDFGNRLIIPPGKTELIHYLAADANKLMYYKFRFLKFNFLFPPMVKTQ